MSMYDKKGPYIIHEEPGPKFYCMCGLSDEPPYCNGSHNGKETGKRPYIVKVEEPRTVKICGCGKSATMPYCDGAHGKYEAAEKTEE
ncbi:CDGSH iron-sulfur domain-containing protein [Brevibacillus dissolubilis]|uniref:CDGSH iron-sulfur domain-containing protein n=1 Tax=Brevibacillus dissolubilis TaxID=1844116 RepID=UPI0011173378|nr:CDGSH iron-sulfur domain-containing protein [Brevibacillus dissolubilis]